jgi:hypothetical protein
VSLIPADTEHIQGSIIVWIWVSIVQGHSHESVRSTREVRDAQNGDYLYEERATRKLQMLSVSASTVSSRGKVDVIFRI